MKRNLFIALFFITNAFAGDGGLVGNGGGLVVCYDSAQQITSEEVLDIFEAKSLRGIEIEKTIPTNLPWKEIAKHLVNRFGEFSQMRQQLYGYWLERFEDEAKFIKGVDLGDVRDAQFIAIPKGCRLETAIIQAKPRMAGDKRYIVNEDLWNLLSEQQKASLVLHELIYREAIAYGHTNSIQVRIMNAFVHSIQIHGITSYETIRFMKDRKFEYTDIPVKKYLGDLTFEAPLIRLWNLSDNEELDDPLPTVALTNRVIGILGHCKNNCDDFVQRSIPMFLDPQEEPTQVELMNDEYHIKIDGVIDELRFGGCDTRCNAKDSYEKTKNLCTDIEITQNSLNIGRCVGWPAVLDLSNRAQSSIDSVQFNETYLKNLSNHLQLQSIPFDASNVFGIFLKENLIQSITAKNFNFYKNYEVNKDEDLYLHQMGGYEMEDESTATWGYFLNTKRSYISCEHEPTQASCYLYLVSQPNQELLGLDFGKNSNEMIMFDKLGRYAYGANASVLGRSGVVLACLDNKNCIRFNRDLITNEFQVDTGSTSLTVGVIGYDIRFSILPGIYPAYKNGFPKYSLTSDENDLVCANYPSSGKSKKLTLGDAVFYNYDQTINFEKTCGSASTKLSSVAKNQFTKFQNTRSLQ